MTATQERTQRQEEAEQQEPAPVVLAIDAATATGWALWRDDHLESGVQRFDLQRGESPGMRFLRFRAWLRKVLTEQGVQVVYYEQAHLRGGATVNLIVGMVTRIEEECAALGLECCPLHTAKLKKWATGKGNADKAAMIAAARKRWPDRNLTDDSEADALWLLDYAMSEIT